MKNVFCDGTEKKLGICRFDEWKNSECKPSEVAGVKCSNQTAASKKVQSTANSIAEKFITKIRLKGGRTKMEGRVEVNIHTHYGAELKMRVKHYLQVKLGTRWGTICPGRWSILEANVVCKHLGLGYGNICRPIKLDASKSVLH